MNLRPVILLVDDDPVSLKLVNDALIAEGAYAVVCASTIPEARQLAELHLPSLFLVDLYLGRENGLELVAWIREHSLLHDAMVMMLTGAGETETKLKGYEAGVDDYIVKPFPPAEFLSRIRALMRIKKMQDQLKADGAELKRLNTALGEHLDALTALLVNIVSLRVPDAAGRSQRAGAYARWMCSRLSLPAETSHTIVLAAKLHEIGKVVIADDVLRKDRTAWTKEDKEVMGQFPLFGHMIVGNVPQLREVGHILRHQAENVDGTGSPDHLIKDQIPFGSRILRIVNAIEEGGGSDLSTIRQQIAAGRGTMFDSRLVQLTEEYLMAVADPDWIQGKREVPVQSLEAGMVLAADLVTSGGIKLLPADTALTSGMIDRILSRHSVDPIITRAYIHQNR